MFPFNWFRKRREAQRKREEFMLNRIAELEEELQKLRRERIREEEAKRVNADLYKKTRQSKPSEPHRHSESYPAGSSTRRDTSSDLLNPLNPLSPISPINPLSYSNSMDDDSSKRTSHSSPNYESGTSHSSSNDSSPSPSDSSGSSSSGGGD